jgi:hypothetical protein
MSTQEEAALEAEAKRRGISVVRLKTILALTNPVTGRDLMGEWQNEADEQRELRWAAARREREKGPKPPEEPKPRTYGWVDPKPLSPPPSDALMEQMHRHEDALWRRQRAKEINQPEPEWVTRMLGPVRK